MAEYLCQALNDKNMSNLALTQIRRGDGAFEAMVASIRTLSRSMFRGVANTTVEAKNKTRVAEEVQRQLALVGIAQQYQFQQRQYQQINQPQQRAQQTYTQPMKTPHTQPPATRSYGGNPPGNWQGG